MIFELRIYHTKPGKREEWAGELLDYERMEVIDLRATPKSAIR